MIGSNNSQGGMSGLGMMYNAMKGGFGSMILVQNTFKNNLNNIDKHSNLGSGTGMELEIDNNIEEVGSIHSYSPKDHDFDEDYNSNTDFKQKNYNKYSPSVILSSTDIELSGLDKKKKQKRLSTDFRSIKHEDITPKKQVND